MLRHKKQACIALGCLLVLVSTTSAGTASGASSALPLRSQSANQITAEPANTARASNSLPVDGRRSKREEQINSGVGSRLLRQKLLAWQEWKGSMANSAESHATTALQTGSRKLAKHADIIVTPVHFPTPALRLRHLANTTTEEEESASEVAPANLRLVFILAGCLFLLATAALVIYWVRTNVKTKSSDRVDEAREAALAAVADAPLGRAVSFSGEDPIPMPGVAPLPLVTQAPERPASVRFVDINPMLSKSKRRLAL